MIGWYFETNLCTALQSLTIYRASFVFAVQTWLAQTPEQAKKSGTPGYMGAGMACKDSRYDLELPSRVELIHDFPQYSL